MKVLLSFVDMTSCEDFDHSIGVPRRHSFNDMTRDQKTDHRSASKQISTIASPLKPPDGEKRKAHSRQPSAQLPISIIFEEEETHQSQSDEQMSFERTSSRVDSHARPSVEQQ